MAEVIWTFRANSQLESTIKYLVAQRGKATAALVLKEILESTRALASQPNMGTIEPALAHRKHEYRFIVIWSYKLIYRVAKDQVIISRVFHTSRNPKNLRGV